MSRCCNSVVCLCVGNDSHSLLCAPHSNILQYTATTARYCNSFVYAYAVATIHTLNLHCTYKSVSRVCRECESLPPHRHTTELQYRAVCCSVLQCVAAIGHSNEQPLAAEGSLPESFEESDPMYV